MALSIFLVLAAPTAILLLTLFYATYPRRRPRRRPAGADAPASWGWSGRSRRDMSRGD